MRLAKKIFLSTSATAINILSGFIRNKIYAIYLSVSLFGILSITQQGVGIIFTLFAVGLPVSISTYASKISTFQYENQQIMLTKILVLIIYQTGFVICVLLFLVIFIPQEIAIALTGNTELVIPVFLVLFASPFMILQNSLSSIMEGMGLVKKITTFKIFPSIIVLPIIFVLVSRYHLTGAALSTLLVEMMFSIFAIATLSKYFTFSASSFKVFDTIKEIVKVALASMSVGIVWLATDFIIKRYLLGKVGLIENGIIQSTAKIIDLYPTVALSWLNIHLFPTLAAAPNNKKTSIAHIERTVLIAVTIIIPIVLILMLARIPVLELLYQKDFIIAEDYFAVMLVSGILKVTSWVLGVALLPLGLKKEWLYSAMSYIGVYVVLIIIGLRLEYGIYVIPFATIGGLFAQLLITTILYRIKHYHFTYNFFLQCLLSIALTILIYFTRSNIGFLIPVILLYCFIIFYYNISSDVFARVKDVIKKTTE